MIQPNENSYLLSLYQKAINTKIIYTSELEAQEKELENIRNEKNVKIDILSLYKNKDIIHDSVFAASQKNSESSNEESVLVSNKNIKELQNGVKGHESYDHKGFDCLYGKRNTEIDFIVSDSFSVVSLGFYPVIKEGKLITKLYAAKRIFYSVKGKYLTIYTLETDDDYELIIKAENTIYKGKKGWNDLCLAFNNQFELKSIFDFFGFTDINVQKRIELLLKI